MARPRKAPPRKSLRVPCSSARVGRPTIFDAAELREIWLDVQVDAWLTERSINSICSTAVRHYRAIGQAPRHLHTLQGAALKRCYYQARALRQRHIDEHAEMLAAFAKHGARADFLTEDCALVRSWNAELQYRIAAAT